MNEKVRNYYLAVLGLCGEILSQKAQLRAPAAPTTAGDELRRMIKAKLIRYHKHADGKRTFRICDPPGYKAIEDIDKRLHDHVEAMVGKHGDRYTGSKEYRLKKRREAGIILMLADAGFTVDGAIINASKSLEIHSKSMIDPSKIIEGAPEGAPLFISGQILKRKGNLRSHQRREMSISSGTLFTKGGIYTTYSISTARFRWFATSEIAAASDIVRLYEDIKDIERHRDGRYRAIFYAETTDVIRNLIASTDKDPKKKNPTEVFRLSYLVPLENAEHAVDITKMLAVPNWRLKADEILGLSPSGKFDGKTGDGRPIYNLLCCNLAKIQEVSGQIRQGKCQLVVHDWQLPILNELYETEVGGTVLSSKHFKGLLTLVEAKSEA